MVLHPILNLYGGFWWSCIHFILQNMFVDMFVFLNVFVNATMFFLIFTHMLTPYCKIQTVFSQYS